jgi:tetratricopeptide (TPR) repeat protein
MSENRFSIAVATLRRAVLFASAGLLFPVPAFAQYIGNAPPPPLPAGPRPGEVETPAAALARAVRTLAQSPRDFAALIKAGRATLDLGDTQAAIGFFGRAEEVRPSDPAPKIGMGAATVADGDAVGALRWFAQAEQSGATRAAIGADRGLAQDLLGNQAAAQVDYRAALAGPDADDARRRLALSLGISGNRNEAFATLQPLLMRRDPAAQRIRAFILALVGDERGASSAIDQAMPGSGARMGGFFRLLPSLSAMQKAAAVHLGIFPDPSEIRVAAVSPRLVAGPASAAVSAPPRAAPPVIQPQPIPVPRFDARSSRSTATATPPSPQPQQVAIVPPPIVPPAVQPAFSIPQPATTAPATAETLKFALPSQGAAAVPADTSPATSTPAPSDRLSGIDRLLAQADELPVPPASRPRFERSTKLADADDAKAKKAADLKKADAKKTADAKKAAVLKKVADAKKLADAKAAAEEKKAREAIGIAGTNWVQLAGGAHADRMSVEFRRLSAKSSTLKKKGGAVTAGKDYFRLLTGPFDSKADAQAFVNRLAKDGVDGFSWTRTPATIKIEKLSPK